ncbi:MAG TPA: PQQ-binding-like beta-propeller repeat protein [Phototrophicaceae bacterium]|nr:PQQ-binding-like beta-propeller repeat protein [Phototrophicaceae bacterium]
MQILGRGPTARKLTAMVRVITLLTIILLLSASAVSYPTFAQTGNVDWPQFQYNAQHTGKSPAAVAPKYKLKWAWFDSSHITRDFVSAAGRNITDSFGAGFKPSTVISEQVQPIVAEGKVYIGTINRVMYALDALTGATRWEFATGGPILQSAAYANSLVVFGSMDGYLYALNASNGSLKWKYKTGAGVSAAPIIAKGLVLVGSRDGLFYAVDLASGALKWSYRTRVNPANTASPFNLAPIITPAAVSEDNNVVLFGAENLFFYGLVTDTGAEKWPPVKLIGQSFDLGWPVVVGSKVIVRTRSSLVGAEWLMEEQLNTLPNNPSWAQEEPVIQNWLNQNPHQKTLYVFDIATGQEPYQVAMGRVSGNNFTPFPPVVDYLGRALTYWRVRSTSFVQDGACFGTNHCPDISALDLATGDRVQISPRMNPGLAPELDNGYVLTTGGEYLYLHNMFRGSHAVNLKTGQRTWIVAHVAKYDCGDFRAWGANIIFYGNDAVTDTCKPSTTNRPEMPTASGAAYAGMPIATTNGVTILYSNEARAGMIAAFEHTN